ncbi:type VI secretion system contractile sheath small subunit [Phycisphaeraceae bacterium D3-23]
MAESTQKKLDRVRKPRVQITYDVEENGAVVKKELPFVVGVLGDFSGNNPGKKPKSLKDRKFVNIDRDNFDEVLASMTPGLKMRVEDTLKGDGSEMAVELAFNSMDDFEPGAVVNQVKPLREMLEARNKLRDLLAKADTSEDLEAKLEEILQSTDSVEKIAGELGISADKKDPDAE